MIAASGLTSGLGAGLYAFGVGLGVAVVGVALIAAGQVFHVLMDTEENTRRAAEMLSAFVPPTVPIVRPSERTAGPQPTAAL